MKSLALTACLVLFAWPALRAESPAANASPRSMPSADQPEGALRDPFAGEGEHRQVQPKIADPLQPMNRAFFRFNDKFYFWVLKPASKGYGKLMPRSARTCLGRLFANVKYPVRLVNHLVQGKVKAAGLETGRFVVNSTVGVAGLFDPAKRWKLEAHPADSDQTLGFYGVSPGIYFDWPLLGPSSARGTAGLAADGALTPWTYIGGVGVSLGAPACGTLNGASLQPGEYESFKKAALDPYVAMRSAYYENRAAAVKTSRGQQ